MTTLNNATAHARRNYYAILVITGCYSKSCKNDISADVMARVGMLVILLSLSKYSLARGMWFISLLVSVITAVVFSQMLFSKFGIVPVTVPTVL